MSGTSQRNPWSHHSYSTRPYRCPPLRVRPLPQPDHNGPSRYCVARTAAFHLTRPQDNELVGRRSTYRLFLFGQPRICLLCEHQQPARGYGLVSSVQWMVPAVSA